jgi:hypothetical protein
MIPRPKARYLYKRYCKFEAQNGGVPLPFDKFRERLEIFAAKVAARQVADVTPAEDALYLAVRVRNTPVPGVDSIQGACSFCSEQVWIHRDMVREATDAKGIICNVCAPQRSGKSLEDLIADQFGRVNAATK